MPDRTPYFLASYDAVVRTPKPTYMLYLSHEIIRRNFEALTPNGFPNRVGSSNNSTF